MSNPKISSKTEKELKEAILQEKARGIPDLDIGQKYGVTFRYIERLITRTQGLNISTYPPKMNKKIKMLNPRDFREERTTVWSFKRRGDWATHSGEYRGNWSPYIPRNVILKYSNPGELVLDYFCGAGTTAVECKLLGRRCIALDINDRAIELVKKNVNFNVIPQQMDLIDKEPHMKVYEPELLVGDARNLSFLQNNSIDLICAHPPYANIIHYTDSRDGDLSFFDIDDFLKEISKVARESIRVLKPGRQCAILIGDTRRKKHVIPLGFKLINVYLDAGFKLRELVIKRQHNCKTTGFWYDNSIKFNFLLLAHEYLPIFEKPKAAIPLSVRESRVGYSLGIPTLEKPLLKIKLDEHETTTVWILAQDDFERHLNKNVIARYSNGKRYSIITFTLHPKNVIDFSERGIPENVGLLFIKATFLNNVPLHLNIEDYLNEMKAIVNRALPNINKGGFLIIQTQDVRVNGYIEPMAKNLVGALIHDNLWLKEIIVVTQDGTNLKPLDSIGYLKIAHQYLLVYEVKG